ncbi:serine/threonine-protein kinase [Salix suchowensis]|nr:serine/threonine-protein kinase [Salix suchowensis]
MVARLMLSLVQHQHPILTTVFFFVLIILVSTSCGADSDNKDYTDCNKPFSCGLLQQLSYPFWGGDRPEVCGHEGFELKCADGQHPILASDALEFRLSSLNQSSRLMTLRLEKSQQYICPAQIQANSSSGSRGSHIFGYDLSLQNLNLLYNCTTSTSEVLSKNRISFCNGYNGSSFYGNDDIFGLLDVDQCSMRIMIPIAKSFDRLVGDRQDLEEVLGDGFNVSYEYDQGPSICEGCMASKGICGTNITHPDKQFMCLCRDQPYAFICQELSFKRFCRPFHLQMNFFRFKKLLSIYNSIFLFTYLASQTASQDPKYKSCEPKSCGAGPSISYPFWLSPEQESLCGHPSFHLTCNNKRPALTISNDVYIINDIFYADNSLLVANAAVFEETCPTPLHNISLDRTPFTISSGYHNFSLLYNCTSKPKNNTSVYALSCATNSTHHSFAGFHLEEIEMNSSYLLNSCHDFVSAPIHTGEDIATSLNRADYSEVLKMGNILLDSNFCVKVADFGLSRIFPTDVTHVSTAPQGTPGYVDPEYHQCYQLTDKSDVYSFGVVMIELISSLPAVDISRHQHEINLSTMAINKIQNNSLNELVDPSLGFESDYAARKMISAVAGLSFQCMQRAKELRPSMEKVVEILKEIQSRDYNAERAEDKDSSSDGAGSLKSCPIPPSPDTVTVTWNSTSSTPYASV